MGFAHDIDLPEGIGMRSPEPLHPFDRRESDPAEMMTGEDPPKSISMKRKLEKSPNKPSRAVLPFELVLDDLLLIFDSWFFEVPVNE